MTFVPRPLSNLKRDIKLDLPPATLRNGFMFAYRCMIKEPTYYYASLAIRQCYPELQQSAQISRKTKNLNTLFFRELIQKAWTALNLSNHTKITKTNNGVAFEVPVFAVTTGSDFGNIRQLANFCADGDQEKTAKLEAPSIQTLSLSTVGGSGLFAKYIQHFGMIKNAELECRPIGDYTTWFLKGTIDTQTVAFMCQVPYNQVRPMDVWSLLYAWVQGRFGAFEKPPLCSIPLSKISETLPKTDENRLGLHGVLVDENANFLKIPAQLDTVADYETDFANKMQSADGSFCAVGPEGQPKVAPRPRPIFVDWVNHKFVYSLTTGRSEVKDLTRCVPLKASHILGFLHTPITQMKSRVQLLFNAAAAIGVAPTGTYDWVKTLEGTTSKAGANVGYSIKDSASTTWVDVFSVESLSTQYAAMLESVTKFKTLKDLFSKILESLTSDPTVAYKTYSVTSVLALMADLECLINYCSQNQYNVLVDKDAEERSAYKNQGVSDGFEMPALPYIAEDRALLPHQNKVQNILKDEPHFALIPVAAGGGKTMTALVELLKLYQTGKIKRGLIMCPSHLVGQYVKEVIYATKGKVNVIPFTALTYMPPPKGTGLVELQRLVNTAPVNTVVVADYNIAKGAARSSSIGYGTAATAIMPIVDLLRSFKFDIVYLDEAHYLKGESTVQQAVARIVSDIPYKRLMTGTFTPNVIQDVVRQVQLFDPTIFGTISDFTAKYAESTRGNRITKYRPGAEAEIMSRLKQNVVVAGASRKEWAAFLPPLSEKSHACKLTLKQQHVYNQILSNAIETLVSEVESNPALKARLYDENGNVREEALQDLLRTTLARLEIFTIAPGSDELGSSVLSGDDLVSPKVVQLIKLFEEHEASGIQGKVLVFCNNHASVDAVMDQLPAALKAKTIRYSADTKTENVAELETNDTKRFMVGVQQSMNTGLNLQVVARLIRLDCVWSPGELEQGNSRIVRPNLKSKENRERVYIDWIIASGTIDVLKSAFLLAKTMQVRKLEEANNPIYADFEPLEIFPMKIETILEVAQLGDEVVQQYFDHYATMKSLEHKDFAAFREANKGYIGADGLPIRYQLKQAPALPESKLLYRVPYVPGTELFNADDLGLVRYDQYLMQNKIDATYLEKELQGEGEDDEEEVETPTTRQLTALELSKVEGLWVHTQFGDGEIVGGSRLRLRVKLASGERVMPRKMACFMITRKGAKLDELRTKVLKEVGEIPFDAPEPIKSKATESVKSPTKTIRQADVAAEDDNPLTIELDLSIANDFPGLIFRGAADNKAAARALQGLGFTKPKPYYYAPIPTYQHLLKQLILWENKGFSIDPLVKDSLMQFVEEYARMRKNALSLLGLATNSELRNFFRLEFLPNKDSKLLSPYPLVEDDQLYLVLPAQGRPASRAALNFKAPGVKWKLDSGEGVLSAYTTKLNVIDKNLAILQRKGFVITNIADIMKQRKRFKLTHPINTGLNKKSRNLPFEI